MINKIRLNGSLLVFLICFLCAGLGFTDDNEYKLELKINKGEKITGNIKAENEENTVIKAETIVEGKSNKQSNETSTSVDSEIQYTDEVISVSNSKPTKVKREFGKYKSNLKNIETEQEQMKETKEAVKESFNKTKEDIEGKIYNLELVDDDLVIKPANSKEKISGEVKNINNENYQGDLLFPVKAVKVKDKWALDEKKLKKLSRPEEIKDAFEEKLTEGLGDSFDETESNVKIKSFSGDGEGLLIEVTENEQKHKIAKINMKYDVEIDFDISVGFKKEQIAVKLTGNCNAKTKTDEIYMVDLNDGKILSTQSSSKSETTMILDVDIMGNVTMQQNIVIKDSFDAKVDYKIEK